MSNSRDRTLNVLKNKNIGKGVSGSSPNRESLLRCN